MTTLFILPHENTFILGADGQESEGYHVRTHTCNKIQQVGDYVYLECGDSAGRTICNSILGMLRKDTDTNEMLEVLFERKQKMKECDMEMHGSMYIFKLNHFQKVTDVYQLNLDDLSIIHYNPRELTAAMADGSGGRVALGAYRALAKYSKFEGKELVAESIKMAAEIDLWTNKNVQTRILELADE